MGNVSCGIPKDMALGIAWLCHTTALFVETGTFKADTAIWAARQFEWVYTVEGDVERYREATKRILAEAPDNVSRYNNSSPDALKEILGMENRPAFLWLDAHYTGDPKHPPVNGEECPLIAELQAVNLHSFASQDVILIDDANFFIVPGRIVNYRGWPTLDQIMRELVRLDRYVFVANDVIVAVPGKFKDKVRDWMVQNGNMPPAHQKDESND